MINDDFMNYNRKVLENKIHYYDKIQSMSTNLIFKEFV